MDNKLKIAIFQASCAWENPQVNIDNAIKAILASTAHLVVMPEMFATGFSMSPNKIAQKNDGIIVTSMVEIAKKSRKAILFSAAINDDGKYYNRLFFIHPDGKIETYDKRHLFRMAGEEKVYTAGDKRLIVNYKGFRICPLVCYDLRFPVFSRSKNDYDVVIYVASWPSVRSYPWDTLLRARAIENQAYCLGVNRVGQDPKNSYSGNSVILDFKGEVMAQATPDKQEVVECEISLDQRTEFIKNFPAYLDADNFSIE